MAVHGFRRTATGRIVVRLDDGERRLLQSLVTQLIAAVAPEQEPADADPLARLVGIEADAAPPTDPALARLFPDGYGEQDPEAAAEFRRFTERSLREGKVESARTMLASLASSGTKVVLATAQAQAWLGALNDLRLMLGTRLEIDEDPEVMQARIDLLDRLARSSEPGQDPADAEAAAQELATLQVYDWLTFLQETLVRAVTGSVVQADPDA